MKNTDKAITIAVMLRHIGSRGGVTVYTRNLLNSILHLDQRNHYVLLFTSAAHLGTYKHYPNVTELLIPASENMVDRIIWDQCRILKAIKEHKADVVFNPKLSVPLLTRAKTVFTMHGLEQFAAKSMFKWYDRIYFTVAMRFYCRRADGILVMTNTGKAALQKYLGVAPEKIHIVPESYNEKCRIITDKSELQRVKAKFSLPDQFIMFVGGIAPLKNIPALIRAFRILKDKGAPHKLVLAGFKRWNVESDLALAESLGVRKDIIEPGFIEDDDISALYNLAACFILPSFYEGFGIPILEAQACGCPVVVGNRGAMREVAGEGGALSFDPDSPQELAEKISSVLKDEAIRNALRERGLQNAKTYSWARTAANTIELFKKLA